MSNPLFVGIIAEGPTDIIIIREIVQNLMKNKRDVKFSSIQPEVSAVFEQIQGDMGTGWSGVYRQIESICTQGAFEVTTNPFFTLRKPDVLIIHIDGDVARETYARGHLSHSTFNKLPCKEIPCPLQPKQRQNACDKNCNVPHQRIVQIQQVLLKWMHLKEKSEKIILCTPLDATDAWILTAFFPKENKVRKGQIECLKNPAKMLKSRYKIDKTVKDYQDKVEGKLQNVWQEVRKKCSAAEQFSSDFLVGAK